VRSLALLVFVGGLFATLACGPSTSEQSSLAAAGRDPHSFARPDEIAVDHLLLDVTVDFEARTISGTASLKIAHHAEANQLWLDSQNLTIHAVTLGDDRTPTDFKIGEPVEHLGSPLSIEIAAETEWVHVSYSSDPGAEALQWLGAEQTTGKRFPFLLSQSQSIFARTWVPCQDSPAVRMTYEAVVRVPQGMMALMSAVNPTRKSPDGVYRFSMPQRVPAYLLALAVGDVEFQSIGRRSGVYAEAEVLQSAAWEFADTEKMIEAAEGLYGAYAWERYDLIVLPASFPFGGMENPRLTFVTPTVLAGDRSLVSLIAHELAHSWSGNLVTNATWNDFWLNEGFTVYFEFRIMEAIYGRPYSEMLAAIGLGDLLEEIETLSKEDTRLQVDLVGRHPDDSFTSVAYDKGYQFLRRLEAAVGRDRWDVFLREYFDTFAFQSMTTDKFLTFLRLKFPEIDDAVDIDTWVHGSGLPDDAIAIDSDAFRRVDAGRERWLEGGALDELETTEWTTHEWLRFIRELPDGLAAQRMAELDEAFGLTETGNAEVLHAWLVHGIRTGYGPADAATERFLLSMGRAKFLRPLYAEMAKSDEGRQRALEIYEKGRPFYHPIASSALDELLKPSG